MRSQVRAGAKRSGGQARRSKAEQLPSGRVPTKDRLPGPSMGTEDRLPGPSMDTEDRLPGPSMDEVSEPAHVISPGLAIPCAAPHGRHSLDHGHQLQAGNQPQRGIKRKRDTEAGQTGPQQSDDVTLRALDHPAVRA